MRIFSSPDSVRHDPGRLNQPNGGSAHYYSEVAARYDALRVGIADRGLPAPEAPSDAGLGPILAVHDERMVHTVRSAIDRSIDSGDNDANDPDRVIITETFAIGARTLFDSRAEDHDAGTNTIAEPDQSGEHSIWIDLGRYTFDTSSPIFAGTWDAAYGAAQSAYAAASEIIGGADVSVALVRPPGHHAMSSAFGGFCYFNNAAIAAQALRLDGRRVCVIDVDVHHGNGTQEIFWNDPDVFTVSLHMDPTHEYPYFWGFAGETGGHNAPESNLNLPLKFGTDDAGHEAALLDALSRVEAFAPDALVIALGVDTYVEDPIGRFALTRNAYPRMAERFASLKLPTVITQEGGYHLDSLGSNVASFLCALGD